MHTEQERLLAKVAIWKGGIFPELMAYSSARLEEAAAYFAFPHGVQVFLVIFLPLAEMTSRHGIRKARSAIFIVILNTK